MTKIRERATAQAIALAAPSSLGQDESTHVCVARALQAERSGGIADAPGRLGDRLSITVERADEIGDRGGRVPRDGEAHHSIVPTLT